MVDLKDRLQKALGRGDRKISGATMNGMYNPASHHSRQPYVATTAGRPPASGTPNYYSPQDSYNPPVPSYPPRPTTPFQANSWGTPANNFSTPPVAAPLQPPPSPALASHPPQAFQPPPAASSVPPPPAASSLPPPPTTGNVSRGGPLSQRTRVYVQDPSVIGGASRSAGYYSGGSQFPGFTPQQQQPGPAMYQPSAASPFSTPTFQSGAPPPLSSSFQAVSNQYTPPTGPFSNGLSFDSAPQSAPQLYNPMEHTSTPHMPGSFMQPSPFDTNAPSITPPPSAPLPSVPTLPASNPPPGWNDPPPIATYSKPKIEAPVETISHPIFATGVVEQPAVPTFQPYDGTMLNPAMPTQPHVPEPEHVQPPPVALPPIPSEHLIIHDVFHTLKDKCAAQASNAVRSSICPSSFI